MLKYCWTITCLELIYLLLYTRLPYLFTYKPSLAISRDPKLKRHDDGWEILNRNWKNRSYKPRPIKVSRIPRNFCLIFHRWKHFWKFNQITPFWTPLTSRSLKFTISRTVHVKTCRAEKCSFTVILAMAADRTKLPPKVVFKGVWTPRYLVVPSSLCISFHKKGWVDKSGVKEWIR